MLCSANLFLPPPFHIELFLGSGSNQTRHWFTRGGSNQWNQCWWSDGLDRSPAIFCALIPHVLGRLLHPKIFTKPFLFWALWQTVLLHIPWIEISSCQNSVHVSISSVPPITAGFHTVSDGLPAASGSNQAADTIHSARSPVAVDWVSCWRPREVIIVNPVESLNALKPRLQHDSLWIFPLMHSVTNLM